jgi:hypothetical protein
VRWARDVLLAPTSTGSIELRGASTSNPSGLGHVTEDDGMTTIPGKPIGAASGFMAAPFRMPFPRRSALATEFRGGKLF